MCIATRCTSVDQFVAMFHRFVDEDSFFVSTVNTRPPGLETSFSVQLADGTPVLRGLCTVLQAWTTSSSPFKTPGVRLGIKRLTANSMPVFERLLVTRSTPQAPPPAPSAALAAGTSVPGAPVASQTTAVIEAPKFSDTVPTKVAVRSNGISTEPASRESESETHASPEIVIEHRTPGSDLILPANPLQNLTDASLEGYVDCTLYEETATFFAVDDNGAVLDELVPPPAPPTFAPRPVGHASTPVEIFSEPSLDDATFEATIESAADSLITPSRRIASTPPPMPVVRADATPPPARVRDALPPTRESTPSGEIVTVAPAPRRRRGVLAAAGVLAIAGGLATWITMRGGADADTATPTPAAKPAPQVAPIVPTPTADVEPTPTPTPPATPDDEDPEMTPGTDGVSPTAGEGPCTLAVASTPAGSIVLLDGKRIAPSPIRIGTTCERHKVDIRHPRYQLGTKVVALKEGTPGSVEITLQRPTHAVKVTSQPSGATIFINGNRAGTTPTILNVLGFSNLKLEFKKTGYAPVTQKLYSKVAQDKVTVKLTKW